MPLTLDFDTLALLNQRIHCTLQSIITYHVTTIQMGYLAAMWDIHQAITRILLG